MNQSIYISYIIPDPEESEGPALAVLQSSQPASLFCQQGRVKGLQIARINSSHPGRKMVRRQKSALYIMWSCCFPEYQSFLKMSVTGLPSSGRDMKTVQKPVQVFSKFGTISLSFEAWNSVRFLICCLLFFFFLTFHLPLHSQSVQVTDSSNCSSNWLLL